MQNQDKIKELLLKENLTEEEKLLLNELIQSDKEAEETFNFYKKLGNAINTNSHLSFEEISDYILFKNNLQPEDPGTIKYIPKIENHLRNCIKCSDEFKNLNSEYSSIETFVASEINTKEKTAAGTKGASPKRFNFLRYGIISVLALILIYGVLFIYSKATAPEYYNLASLNKESDFYATRGRATDDFIKGLNALDEENFNSAVNYFRSDIKNNPDDKTIFYSYYILGLTYLDNSENDFAGLFPGYNVYFAGQSLKNLRTAIKKNNSGSYINITLDARFYSAKANLILGNTDEAKKDLETVIKEKGSKMEEAKNILRKLN